MDYLQIIKKLEQDSGVNPETRDWLSLWRDLADLTYGIDKDDIRFQPVMTALTHCDEAFLKNDWIAFQVAQQEVHRAVRGQ